MNRCMSITHWIYLQIALFIKFSQIIVNLLKQKKNCLRKTWDSTKYIFYVMLKCQLYLWFYFLLLFQPPPTFREALKSRTLTLQMMYLWPPLNIYNIMSLLYRIRIQSNCLFLLNLSKCQICISFKADIKYKSQQCTKVEVERCIHTYVIL